MTITIGNYSTNIISISLNGLLDSQSSKKVAILLDKIWSEKVEFSNNQFLIDVSKKTTPETVERIKKTEALLSKMDYNILVDQSLNEKMLSYDKKIRKIEENEKIMRSIKNNCFSEENFNKYKSELDQLLTIKLREYQYKSSYLLSLSGYGFDFSVPGSGKTIISYSSYAYLKKENRVNKILIVGPKNSCNAWLEEYITCFGKTPDFINLSDMDSKRVDAYLNSSKGNHHEINFINIEKVRNLEKSLKKFVQTDLFLMIIDEGHKIKNPEAKSTLSSLKVGSEIACKFLLTGTPMPNGYEDLSSLTNFIVSEYNIIPLSYSDLKKLSLKNSASEEEKIIMDSIFPYFSRVSKKFLIENGELLEPKHNFCLVQMDRTQQKIYDYLDGIYDIYKNDVDNELLFSLMKAILIRKMQVSSNPMLLKKKMRDVIEDMKFDLVDMPDDGYVDSLELNELKLKLEQADKIILKSFESSDLSREIKNWNFNSINRKNEKAVELAKELVAEGKKVIIWDTFVENMNLLSKMFDFKVGIINGNVVGEERRQILNGFRNGELYVLIASPATLAESISLHKSCQFAIYLNRNYNAAQFIQSKDRIHRINMPNGTTANYIYMLNENTVDSKINERLIIKEERMLRILDNENLSVGDLESPIFSVITEEDVRSAF